MIIKEGNSTDANSPRVAIAPRGEFALDFKRR
jgi:hypothetical protein